MQEKYCNLVVVEIRQPLFTCQDIQPMWHKLLTILSAATFLMGLTFHRFIICLAFTNQNKGFCEFL